MEMIAEAGHVARHESARAAAAVSDISFVQHLVKSLFVMASMIEQRDRYTGGHLWRVSQYSRLIAEQMSLESHEVARIALGGFLHDLGKIGIPDAILNKPGKLTDDEYDVMRTHAIIGMRLLEGHPLARIVSDAILMHHETPDGCGYPNNLNKDGIPLVARIVGLADAFDAMTSNRPYRREMPKSKALEIVKANVGRQFDPEVVRAFSTIAESEIVDHIIGHSEPGIPVQTCPLCGPTIVIHRNIRDGALVYCPICLDGDFVFRDCGAITLVPANRRASPLDLAPTVDTSLIDELVSESCRLLDLTSN